MQDRNVTHCDLLIKNTTALMPDMTLREGVSIAVDGGDIVAIDDSASIEARYRAKETLDGAGKVAMPGLIDAHTHVCQQLLRGRITDEPPMIWVRFLVPFESQLQPEDVYWSAKLAIVEMIKAGITSFADAGGRHMAQVARAVAEMGVRAAIARSTMDSADFVPDTMKDTATTAIAKTEALYDAWHGRANDRIHIWFALRQVMTSTPDLVDGHRGGGARAGNRAAHPLGGAPARSRTLRGQLRQASGGVAGRAGLPGVGRAGGALRRPLRPRGGASGGTRRDARPLPALQPQLSRLPQRPPLPQPGIAHRPRQRRRVRRQYRPLREYAAAQDGDAGALRAAHQ